LNFCKGLIQNLQNLQKFKSFYKIHFYLFSSKLLHPEPSKVLTSNKFLIFFTRVTNYMPRKFQTLWLSFVTKFLCDVIFFKLHNTFRNVHVPLPRKNTEYFKIIRDVMQRSFNYIPSAFKILIKNSPNLLNFHFKYNDSISNIINRNLYKQLYILKTYQYLRRIHLIYKIL